MKTRLRHRLASVLFLLPALASAQVPNTISYQGRVLNPNGSLVGAATPENRTVIFRIWDGPTADQLTNLIYSETQTVTISGGEFSALVGEGSPTNSTTLGFSETSRGAPTVLLQNSFGSTTRFLGVTVSAGAAIAASDFEIAPRQQIVSSAFAFRAAALAPGGTIAGAITATGSTITGGTFSGASLSGTITNSGIISGGTLAGTITNSGTISGGTLAGTITNSGTISGGSFSGNGSGLTLLNASNIASGTLSDARLSANIPRLDNVGSNIFAGTMQIVSGEVRSPGSTPYLDFSNTPAGDYNCRLIYQSNELQIQFQGGSRVAVFGNFGASGNIEAGGNIAAGGNITAASKPVAVGEESLRIVRGIVRGTTGNIGSGYSVTTYGTTTTITFNPAFTAVPAVTVTGEGATEAWHFSVQNVTTSSVQFVSRRLDGAQSVLPFHFIAVGPR